jgi:cytochrome c556
MNGYLKVLCAGAVGAGMSFAIAASSGAATPTEQRQASMKQIAQSMKEGAAFNAANAPFDGGKVKTIMGGVAKTAKTLHGLFPAQSASDPKTAALPVAWSQKADLARRIDELARLADAASKAKSAEAYKPAFLAVGATCKSCHDTYRKKAS